MSTETSVYVSVGLITDVVIEVIAPTIEEALRKAREIKGVQFVYGASYDRPVEENGEDTDGHKS